MRPILAIFIVLLCRSLCAQFEYADKPLNQGQAIAVGGERAYSDAMARISVLEQLVPPYIPTWTWPGHETPEAFDRLREHMAGEVIYPQRDVSKWSRAELAFIHDCDHVDELLRDGKGLPLLKDQRLQDWVRAKNPAKPLKHLSRAVKRIVIHVQNNCPPCERWKRDEMPKALADGAEVQVSGAMGRATPWFEFCSESKCVTSYGYLSYEGMKTALR